MLHPVYTIQYNIAYYCIQCNLSITVQPMITSPANGPVFIINETDMFSVTCNVTGISAPINFVWLKDGIVQNYTTVPDDDITVSDPSFPVSYSTDGGDIWLVSQTLTFSSAIDEDSGVYICMASNGVGDGDSVSFELIVQSKHTTRCDYLI